MCPGDRFARTKSGEMMPTNVRYQPTGRRQFCRQRRHSANVALHQRLAIKAVDLDPVLAYLLSNNEDYFRTSAVPEVIDKNLPSSRVAERSGKVDWSFDCYLVDGAAWMGFPCHLRQFEPYLRHLFDDASHSIKQSTTAIPSTFP